MAGMGQRKNKLGPSNKRGVESKVKVTHESRSVAQTHPKRYKDRPAVPKNASSKSILQFFLSVIVILRSEYIFPFDFTNFLSVCRFDEMNECFDNFTIFCLQCLSTRLFKTPSCGQIKLAGKYASSRTYYDVNHFLKTKLAFKC